MTMATRGEESREQGFFYLDSERPRQSFDKKHFYLLVVSYGSDWALTLVVTGLFFLLNKVDGFKREFSLTDTSLQHTLAIRERVNNTELFLVCGLAPLILMPIINLISIRSFWDFHVSWLGAILALGLTGSITNIVKITVGRPRPDVIDRCQPIPGATDKAVFGLVNASICTQTDVSILRDGFRSFPSGHSSLSFAGLGFLFFYLSGKLHLFDRNGHTLKAWIAPIPLTGAALVAITRTMDYRHHWHDVLIGSLLGFSLAWFSYRQYYPSLTDSLSHRPYSPRIRRNRTPLTHFHGNAEVNGVTPDPFDSRHSDNIEMQTQGSGNKVGASTLTEMWREGEGEEIVPLGQSSPRLSADERV